MSNPQLKVLGISGSLKGASVTRVAVARVLELLRERGCEAEMWDLGTEPLPLFDPSATLQESSLKSWHQRVAQADVYVLGTPDYHGSMSGTLKNFLDHYWHEFSGKLFASVVASHEKGLTVTDHLRTIARQCYAWTVPYGVSLVEDADVKDGSVVSENLSRKLQILARDLDVYGNLLSAQRRKDLACDDACFMGRYRPK